MKTLRTLVLFSFSALLAFGSVASPTARISYTITALPATLPTSFAFNKTSTVPDLLVLDGGATNTATNPGTTLTYGSDYTVTGGGYNSLNQLQTGNVVVVGTGTHAVQVGDVLTILRNVPLTQTTTFSTGGFMTPLMVESALDKLTLESQQIFTRLGNTLLFPANETTSGTLLLADRANKLLGFAANGSIQYYTPAGSTFVNGAQLTADSIASLKALALGTFVTGQQVVVAGYYLPNDGNGGLYVYNSASSATDNGGTVIAPNVGTGRWLRSQPTGFVNVGWFGARVDGVSDDAAAIQAAIDWTAAQNGGTVQIATGTAVISTTLNITTGNVRLTGAGSNMFHDGGTTMTPATKLLWSGGASPMVYISTPAVVTNSKIYGSDASLLALDGNTVATYGILIVSANGGQYTDLFVTHVVTAGYKVSNWTAGTLAEATDSQMNIFTRAEYRLTDNVGERSAHGFLLTSASPGLAGANTSYNSFFHCDGQVYNGIGLLFEDADNNSVYSTRVVKAGGGANALIEIRGVTSDANHFYDCAAGGANAIKILGASSGYTGNPSKTTFLNLDGSNGTQIPYLDPGCYDIVLYDTGPMLKQIFGQAVIADSYANALTARPDLATESLRVFNASQNHVVLANGTDTWGFNIDASSNVRINRQAGAGLGLGVPKLGVGADPTTTSDVAIVHSVPPSTAQASVVVYGALNAPAATDLHPNAFRDTTIYTSTAAADAYASFDAQAQLAGTLNYNHFYGFQARQAYTGIGTLGTMAGYNASLTVTAGTVTELRGYYVPDAIVSGGTVTHYTGLFLDQLTAGTTRHAIYANSNDPWFSAGGQIYTSALLTTPAGATTCVLGGTFNQTAQTGLAIMNSNATATGVFANFCNSGGTVQGSISQTNSTTTAFNTSSDRRLKEHFRKLTDSGKIIDGIQPVIFDWKWGGKDFHGVVAQDLARVYPEAVHKGDTGKDVTEPWQVDYSKLVPVLVAQIKELRQRVSELEAQQKK